MSTSSITPKGDGTPVQNAAVCAAGERFAPDLKAYVDGELSPLRRAAVRRHVASCAACRMEVGEVEETTRLLLGEARAASQSVVSPALRARLIDTMQTEAAGPASRPLPFWRARPAAVFGTAGAVLAAAGVAFLGMYTSLLPTAGGPAAAPGVATESAPAPAAPAAAPTGAGARTADTAAEKAPGAAGRLALGETRPVPKAAPQLRAGTAESIRQDKVPEPQASALSGFSAPKEAETGVAKAPVTVRAPQPPVGAAVLAPRPAAAPPISASLRSEPPSLAAKAPAANASTQSQLRSGNYRPREQAKKALPEPEHAPYKGEMGAATVPASPAAGAPAIMTAAPGPAVPPAPASLGGFGGSGAAAGLSTAAVPQGARQVHRQATLGVVVEDVEPAAGRVEQIVAAAGAGAFVASKEMSDGPDGVKRAVLTLRVPSEDLDAVLRQVAALGQVEAKSDRSEDVTEEFNDALRDAGALASGARSSEPRHLRADEEGGARQSTRRSKETPDPATLKVQQALARARLETLRKKGALATLRVRLREQKVPEAGGGGPAAPPPAPPQTQTTG